MKKEFMLLPLVLAGFSAVAWRRPERSLSVLLGLAATLLSPLGVMLFRPLGSLAFSCLGLGFRVSELLGVDGLG